MMSVNGPQEVNAFNPPSLKNRDKPKLLSDFLKLAMSVTGKKFDTVKGYVYHRGCPRPDVDFNGAVEWLHSEMDRIREAKKANAIAYIIASDLGVSQINARNLILKGMPTDNCESWRAWHKGHRARIAAERSRISKGRICPSKGAKKSWIHDAATMCGTKINNVQSYVKSHKAPRGALAFTAWYFGHKQQRAEYLAGTARRKAEYQKAYKLRPEVRLRDRTRLQSPHCVNYRKEWRQRNIEKLRARTRQRDKQRRATDPGYRAQRNLRSRFHKVLKLVKAKKLHRTATLVGCTAGFLKEWIEGQWKRGMTWENYGSMWEIDHKIPLTKFDMSQPDQQLAACHYSNLQPLWKLENHAKSDHIIHPTQPELTLRLSA